mgnify:CR=1 FL=1
MLKVNEDHVEMRGNATDVMAELVFAIDAVVRLHEEEMGIPKNVAKVMVHRIINKVFDEIIATDDIRENLEETTIKIKLPRGDADV